MKRRALTCGRTGPSCLPSTGCNAGPVQLSEEEFGELVERALDSIPERLGRLMRNVAVVVEDYGGSPNLLGPYHGVPLTARTAPYSGGLPHRTALYRLPILARVR